MKEIELRLALVFYGGVSLAIYMHGVSREVLNLVRASTYRVTNSGRNRRSSDTARAPSAAEKVYQDFLTDLAARIDIHVVADAIAGASAGGVNGIMLARAVAHDLPLDDHRALWLENADVTRLAQPLDGLTRYLKSGAGPVLNRLVETQLKKQIDTPETREKLKLFMQSRWFSPPFSGEKYIGWMLDACAKMDEHFQEGGTLIPRGQTLDLFVTLTDFKGQRRRIHIDDPAFIEEWDHRRIVNFHAEHRVPGMLQSQLGPQNVAELVFAARATSSFPGAFPPLTVAEMEKVLKARGETWPHRDAFLLKALGLSGTAAADRCFVDGSVVMNKPFAPVIEVIQQRPASREVARRLIYVDPVPAGAVQEGASDEPQALPGFFRVILASLAHIPRNEPIGDELKEIEARNRRSRWLAQTITAADPVVDQAVRKILPKSGRITPADLTRYRGQANTQAHVDAGYAYLNYQALKLHAVSERLASLAAGLAMTEGTDVREEPLLARIGTRFSLLAAAETGGPRTPDGSVVSLLRGLDVDYRIRRLRFVIRCLNGFYRASAAPGAPEQNPDALDVLKGLFYEQIDHLSWRWKETFYGQETRDLCQRYAAATLDRKPDENPLGDDLDLADLLGQLEVLMGLTDLDSFQDDLIASCAGELLTENLHAELLRAYVGFAFYDLVTFPLLQTNDFAEINETLVDRISSSDVGILSADGVVLKGKELNTFGAFFNRSWREHDYLWGRLNAADRLISIVQSVAGAAALDPAQALAYRRKLMRAILIEETQHLPNSVKLIAGLLNRVDELDIAALSGETIRPDAFQTL